MIAEFLLNFVLEIISFFGYFGVFFLMFLESTVVPVPSELVLPFAGFLVSQGTFDFITAAIAATIGSISGSWFSFILGKKIGRAAIARYGKFVFLKEKDLDLAHSWFEKFGTKTVFFCRFVPVVRHVISIPAGIAEMNLAKFLLYTATGALLWNSFLIFAGMQLGNNWKEITKFSSLLDIVAIIGIIAFLAWFFYRHMKKN